MQFRTTIALFVVAVAMVGYIWFVERHQESTDDRIRRDVEGRTLEVSWSEVKAFEVTRDGETVRLERVREPDVWEVVKPARNQASKRAVDEILARMEIFREKRRVPPPVDFARLGLDPPRIVFRVWWGEKDATLHLGDPVAVGSNPDRYARWEGAAGAFTVDPQVFKALDKPPSGFMERRLFDVAPEKIDRVTLASTGAAGGPPVTLEFVRTGDDWWIAGAHDLRPDLDQLRKLIEAIKGAEVQEWLDATALAANPADLDKPWLRATVAEEGPKGKSVVAEFGAPVNPERSLYYGKRSGADGGFTAKASVPAALEPDPVRLRSKIYFDLPEHHLARIEIRSPWGKTAIASDESGWQALEPAGLPVDYGSVHTWLTRIKVFPMVEFPGPATVDLAPFGLDRPRITLAVTMMPPDRSRTDNYEFRIGWTDAAPDRVFAITKDGREVVRLDPGVLSEFRKGPLAFRRKDVFHAGARTRIRSFTLDRVLPAPEGGTPARRTQVCSRDRVTEAGVERDTPWMVREDSTVKKATPEWAEEVAAHLTDLYALDFVESSPGTLAPFGLDAPAVTVTFTWWNGEGPQAGQTTEVLKIGGSSPDGLRYAMLAAQPIVFVIDPGMAQSFERDLTLPPAEGSRQNQDPGIAPKRNEDGTPIQGQEPAHVEEPKSGS